MLDKFTNHIGTLSVLMTVIASFFTMTFIFAYLSPFDLSLIWLIEYSDILKFCLIGVAILSCIFAFGMNYFEEFYNWMSRSFKQQIIFLIGVFIVLSAMLASSLYNDTYISRSPKKEFHVFFYLTVVFLIILAVSLLKAYAEYSKLEKPVTFNILPTLNLFALVALAFVLLGRTAGLAMRDVAAQTHTITFTTDSGLKDAPLAKIIMVTSQYTIFQTPEGLVTVPSSVVMKMKTNPIVYKCDVCP